MYLRSFVCQEVKIKEDTQSKKELHGNSKKSNMEIPIYMFFFLMYHENFILFMQCNSIFKNFVCLWLIRLPDITRLN